MNTVSCDNADLSPLVSIGVPVRNGAPFIDEALQLLVDQTYRNIEIIISDNASSDETVEICQKYLARDGRISYFRHEQVISALDNFRFTVERANGQYFMWAAHDDRRSLNYVQALADKLKESPTASMVFTDVAIFHDFANWTSAPLIPYDFTCLTKAGFWSAVLSRSYIREGYLHVYGLIRRSFLLEYKWFSIEIGPDRPLLFYLSRRGDFVKAENACFYCYKPPEKKSSQHRARRYYRTDIKRFPYVRLAWACASAGQLAENQEGRHHNMYLIFAAFVAFELKKRALRASNKLKRMLQVKS